MKLLKIFIFGLIIILISKFAYSQWYAIVITNTQSQATPAPFQQDIAICNGNPGIGSNFAYVNNATLFNQIDSNGQNVYFTTTAGGSPNIYSWYEGQENLNGTYCDVWWVNISNGIPANGNVTIYMYIGSTSANYYSQYYPYVGEAPTLSSTYGQYDNGNYVFNYYWNFNGTSAPPGINVYTSYGSVTFNNGVTIKGGTTTTGGENGIATTVDFSAPIIVEYYGTQSTSPSGGAWGWNYAGFSNCLGSSASFPQCNYCMAIDFEYGVNALVRPTQQFSGTSVNGILSAPSNNLFPASIWTQEYLTNEYYTYVNYTLSLYTGYMYGTSISVSLPFIIMVGNNEASYASNGMTVYWLRVRAYPPNGVMPSISIQPAVSVSSVQLNPSSSSSVCPGTQTSSTATVNLNNPNGQSTTVTFSCSAPSGISCSFNSSSCTTSGSSCSTTLYVNSSSTTPPGSYSVTVTASTQGTSASATYTYNIGQQISISSQQSSNFQNSYSIYITGCSQNYTLYVNNSPYCYDSYSVFQNINSLCTVSYPGSYSVYAQGCYNGTCVNSNTINLNIQSGITVPIIDINILNITNQNINTTISVNGSNQNIQSINVYYNNNNVYSNSNVNTNYYSFNLQLSYSNNGNITVCSTLTNGQSNCVTEIFNVNVSQTYIYYGIIQLKAYVQPININTTYGPIGNNLEFSLDYPGYILTLNITNIGNITLNNVSINILQFGNVPEILYNQIPIQSLNNININQLQPNQSYILQFSVLPLYIGSSSLLLSFNVNGQNIGNAQYNLIVNGPSNKSSLIVSENINYILILVGIIGSIIFLI
jgi:hypothetical protein